jgi:hypothetical protein
MTAVLAIGAVQDHRNEPLMWVESGPSRSRRFAMPIVPKRPLIA